MLLSQYKGYRFELLGQHYEKIKNLGVGTYGEVFKCLNVKTKKMVAVKVIKSRYREIGRQEIYILQRLRCLDPDICNLVRFNSYFLHNKAICLSFELLDIDLNTYISLVSCQSWNKGLPLSEVRVITEQMATALHYLKSISIVHGDVKPDNIMIVDSHQQPMKVKLGDFGGAQITSELDPETLLHTFCYSSPELLLACPFNEAVDVWSLGVTLMELALGDDLFIYNERYDLLRCIIKTLGQPPDHVLDGGTRTQSFFNKEIDVHPQWILKSEEQYRCESNTVTSPIPEPFDCFSDIESYLMFNRENHTGLDLFLDLIQRMLHIDPEKRIKPLEVVQHSFIDGTKTNVKDQCSCFSNGGKFMEHLDIKILPGSSSIGILQSIKENDEDTLLENPREVELANHKVQLEPSADVHPSFTVVHENPKEKDVETLLKNSREVKLESCEVELEPSTDVYNSSTVVKENPKEKNVETLLENSGEVELENCEVKLESSEDIYSLSTALHQNLKEDRVETILGDFRKVKVEDREVQLEPATDVCSSSTVVHEHAKKNDAETRLENSEENKFKNHEGCLEPSADIYSSSTVVHESSKENSGEVRSLNHEVQLDPSGVVRMLEDNRKDVSCFTCMCRHVRENVGSYGRALILAAAACSILVLMRSSKH